MNKIVVLLVIGLAVVMAVALLVSCEGSAEEPAAPGNVSVDIDRSKSRPKMNTPKSPIKPRSGRR